MKKEIIKVLTLIIILIVILFIVFILNSNGKYKDTIKYDDKTYILLEYNMDIFTYNLNRNAYYEEDIIHPISHNKWDIVYFNGEHNIELINDNLDFGLGKFELLNG